MAIGCFTLPPRGPTAPAILYNFSIVTANRFLYAKEDQSRRRLLLKSARKMLRTTPLADLALGEVATGQTESGRIHAESLTAGKLDNSGPDALLSFEGAANEYSAQISSVRLRIE